MRILTRYILREVTSHALLGGALFTFIIFTRDLGKILEFVVRDSASYTDVIRIIAYTLPNGVGEHDLLRLSDQMRAAADQVVGNRAS